MMHYLNTIFCEASGKTCGNVKCKRYFQKEDEGYAKKWWGDNDPPIAWNDYSLGCPDIQPIPIEEV